MSEGEILEFREAPESELMRSNRRGRPRDTTFDSIVRTAFDSEVAQTTTVSAGYVDDLVRGIRNAASHLKVSVSFVVFDPDDEGMVRVEFIAYPTQRRNPKGQTKRDDDNA